MRDRRGGSQDRWGGSVSHLRLVQTFVPKSSTLLNHMNRPITCTAFHSLFFCQLSFRGKREAIQSLEFVSRGPHFSDRLHLLHQQGGSELHLDGALFVFCTCSLFYSVHRLVERARNRKNLRAMRFMEFALRHFQPSDRSHRLGGSELHPVDVPLNLFSHFATVLPSDTTRSMY